MQERVNAQIKPIDSTEEFLSLGVITGEQVISGKRLDEKISECSEKTSGRQDILETAASCVLKDRAATHGDLEDSFAHTATLWGAHLGVEVSATDVAVMMALLKIARIKSTPTHKDNWVDLAGYAACGGELAMRDQS